MSIHLDRILRHLRNQLRLTHNHQVEGSALTTKINDLPLACISHRPSAEMSLGAAGTSAQCRILFRFGSNQNIPNEFCFDAAADRNGPFAIGVGLTVLPPLGVAWRTRGKCLRMNRIERDPEKYVALGTRACSAETHLGARAMRNAG